MRRRTFFWHVYPMFLVAIVTVVTVVVIYDLREAKRFYYRVAADDLKVRAVFLAGLSGGAIGDTVWLDTLCKLYGRRTGTRITVVRPNGRVIADSDHPVSTLDNHSDRPEIAEALRGDTGYAVRYSSTLRRDLSYVAVPLRQEERIAAVVRASVPVRNLSAVFAPLSEKVISAALIAALLAALLSLLVARRLSAPLESLTEGAERLARGDFSAPLHVPRLREEAGLAVALNAMAEQLDERIKNLLRKNNEQSAVLSAMVEGVVALDSEERVIMVNQAARGMLGMDDADPKGRLVQEVIRSSELQKLFGQLLANKAPLQTELRVEGPDGEKWFETHGIVIGDALGSPEGVLVVLYDITRLKKLESVRKEFVGNVSHELRTPLTSIKGFVETLMEGSAEDADTRNRFLGIIGNQVNRLNTLVDDLLTISQLESTGFGEHLTLGAVSVAEAVKDAVEVCSHKAVAKGMAIDTSVPPELSVSANRSLLEQVLINLVDNAVTYSPAGTRIQVQAMRDGADVAISVRDQGPGIEKQHQSRIFERFYRVDKARSKKLGGTGLGLSIVKHIMEVHRGRVEVASEVGKGSTFTVWVRATEKPERP